MRVRREFIESAVSLFDTKLHAMALLASCIYELAFQAADEEARGTNGIEAEPAQSGAVVFLPAARVLRRVGDQIMTWADQFCAMAEHPLTVFRNRIAGFAEKDGWKLARRLPHLLGPQDEESPPVKDEGNVSDDADDPRSSLEVIRKPRTATRWTFHRVEIPDCCPSCSSPLVFREGRYGLFRGCTNFKGGCKTTAPAYLGVRCPEPECNGQLVEKSIPDGVGGYKIIVGCSNYKRKGCDFVEYNPPERVPCHRCGLPFRIVIGDARVCIDPVCLPSEDEAVENILEYAVRTSRSLSSATNALTVAAGIAIGMTGATLDAVTKSLSDGRAAGMAWRKATSPG